MKTKAILVSLLSLGFTVNLFAQLPGINKVKVPKIKKEETTTTGNTETTETAGTTGTKSDPADDEARTQMAYYFNDKNGELSALYNYTVGRYDQNGYFCRGVLKMNPQEVKNKIAECEKKWPDTYNENFWVVSEFKPRIESYSTDMITKQSPNFEKYQKECDAFVAQGNYVKALVVAKYMDSLALAMISFQPEDANVKAMKEKSEANISGIQAKLSVYHGSPFHSQNAGKILFSKNEIVSGSENSEMMSTVFTDNDHIFVAVYLEGRIKDYDQEAIFIRVEPAGLNYGISMEYKVTPENENQSVIMIPLVCSPSQTQAAGTYDVVKMLADNSKAGDSKITVSVLNTNQRLQLERGEIYSQTITLSGTDGSYLKKLREEFYKIEVANARIPAPVIKNATLEADAKKVSTDLFVGNVTPLRASLQENWNVEYDDYGTPSFRYLRAFIAIKDNNTGKCHYQMMKIGQDYAGAGTYGATYLYDPAAPYDLNEIECGNVNK